MTLNAFVFDNRRVTAPAETDIGYVHLGDSITSSLVLSTIGADDRFTRIKVANSTGSDVHGVSVSGGNTAFQFGLDGMSATRSIGGTPNGLGNLQGTINLTTLGETGVVGTQTLANVSVPYTVHVYSGKAMWNDSAGGNWSDHPRWLDSQSASGGSPGVSGLAGDTATFGPSIGDASVDILLNGADPTLSSLAFDNNQGGSYALLQGTSGTISLSGNAGNPSLTVTSGSHRIASPISVTGNANVAVDLTSSVLTIDGDVTTTGGLNKFGAGELYLTGVNSFAGPITVRGGTLRGSLGVLESPITNDASVVLDLPSDATYTQTMTGSGSLSKTGAGKLMIAGTENVTITGPIHVTQGTLAMPFGTPRGGGGVSVSANGTFEVAGIVPQAVTGTGTVTATSDLIIGQSSQGRQFDLGGTPSIGGTLNVANNAFVILSADTAVLGTATNISDEGSFTTLNGARLGNPASADASKALFATGNATVNGDFVNNGTVNGPTSDGQWLKFTQDVTGAGNTTGNILYAGGYSPGNSAAVVFVANIAFDSTSVLAMEIGGLIPGEFDQLNVSGLATLDGTLELSLINDYLLEYGRSYPLISGDTVGEFDQVTGLPNGWHLDYGSRGVMMVPEPSTLALLLVLGIGLSCCRRRIAHAHGRGVGRLRGRR